MEDATDFGEGAAALETHLERAEAFKTQHEGVQLDDQEAPTYVTSKLARPLSNWEISRDHLVFASICGLDTNKRHILHVLEPRNEGVHGGVLLTAVGNTVQVLSMSLQVAPSGSSVQSRRYVFGFSGSGIGCLAVHPSRQFFAVGEKGEKPYLTIYRYPQITVSQVLRNGTERAYASVDFSKDGHTLASVGTGPDYLLTVWNWRLEQIVLRCKAFGQDVFTVRFAPTDSGFLATGGVGHIRFWKMAATFTGLKLQGDIGKFGKSELSDIEAFCVLPDKKVLSGTERGVLLLWDGNFIKCEILTSRRRLPHAGPINVVELDEDEGYIVTAGKDGYVRFWNLDSIDSADVAADETVALIPMKRQVLVMPHMDIRAVVKEDIDRYLLQDSDGGVHLLLLYSDDEHDLQMNYIPNDTGRATGIACSPYEHLAATCGEDGSVRAWDYVSSFCVIAVFSGQSNDDKLNTVAASAIAWVPNSAAVTNNFLPASRQVVVGFDNGLVRVLLMDVDNRAWILVNVFKPHSKRVTCVAYSHSGSALVTASTDGTFFIFHVVQSNEFSDFAKYKPEYKPHGFQRVPASVVAMCWRDDDAAILLTLANGLIIEYFLPDELDGKTEDDQENSERSESTPDSNERACPKKNSPVVRESFEIQLLSREWTLRRRNRYMTVKELDILEAQSSRISSFNTESKGRNQFQVEVTAANGTGKPLAALYAVVPADDTGNSLCHAAKDCIYLSCEAPLDASLFMVEYNQPLPLQEFASESTGQMTFLALSSSKRFILCGLSNGKFQLRSSQRPHAFLSGEFHDYAASTSNNKLHLALSFDDSYVLAVGSDGNLSICRLHNEKVEEASRLLAGKLEDILAEAAIAGDQAHEMQKTALTMQQKAMDTKTDDDPSENGGATITGLSATPAFHGAKAFAAYIESRLSPSVAAATDSEQYSGVVRLITDVCGTDGLFKEKSLIRDKSGLNVESGALSTACMQFRVEDLANSTEAYTLEDAKLKSVADARARSMLGKQDSTRDVVAKLRRQFEELQAHNAALPPQSRIDPDEWEIDLDYGDLLKRHGDEACEEVRKELAFAVEKEKLLLFKLREAYVGSIAVDLLTLCAFESGLSVQSFRTMKMPAILQKRLAEIHTVDRAAKKQSFVEDKMDGPSRRPSVLDVVEKYTQLDENFPLKEDERRSLLSYKDPVADGKVAAGWSPSLPTTQERGGSKSVHGFEARKRLRAERNERLARWQSSKPGDDADDPRDVIAIAFAQRNMGDYKLKTAADYVVPEHERVNTVKKLRQMALLEEDLYTSRLRFNVKVLELRDLKVRLTNELQRDQERRRQLLSALDAKGSSKPNLLSAVPIKSFFVDPCEWPEKREHVTDADIDHHVRGQDVRSHAQAHISEDDLSLMQTGAFQHLRSSDRSIAAVTRVLEATSTTTTRGAATEITIGHLHMQLDEEFVMATATPAAVTLPLTEAQPSVFSRGHFDEDEEAVCEYVINREILLLEGKQQRKIAVFDAAVAHLRREKLSLEVGFKQSELRLFTLNKELSLLESFESKENLLSSRLEKSKGEKAQIVAELRDVNDLLMSKKRDLEDWSRQEKVIQAEFLTLVNGGTGSTTTPHSSFAALQKLFKRKIKRVKKKSNANGKGGDKPKSITKDEEQDGEDEDDDEDDDDCDEDDDDDDEDDEETCPPGCELALYEKVLALREKRADADDAMAELNKGIDELRKAGERQTAKQRAVDKELAATEQDTQRFQSEKQSRFNLLDVVVPLSTQQLRCLESPLSNQPNMVLPPEATGCLVFTNDAFSALTERIESLQAENKQLRQQFRDLHKQQNVLAREKHKQVEGIARAQERSEQLMRLKFGQLVDLEVLDRACDSSMVDDLQTRVKLREIECDRAVRRVKQTHPKLQHAFLQATEQNTALLRQIAALTERQAELERKLNRNQDTDNDSRDGGVLSFEDNGALVEREMMERNKLVRLVKLQAREVEALKQEIGLLRGKDGKVYAPR